MAESFFGVLKNELVHRTRYINRGESEHAIIRYIEFWSDRRRLHSAIGYRPPIEVFAEHRDRRLAT